jgi:type II secretory pathway component PulM
VNAAHAWWAGRSVRERRVLQWAAAALVLALAFVLWLEAERTRARLNAELPRLRASIAALERDAAEVRQVRSLPVAPAQALAQSPLAALATNGGGLPGAQIAVLDERRVKVAGEDVGVAALLEFLRNAQVTHGMRVESARVDALAMAGRVRVELLLARS